MRNYSIKSTINLSAPWVNYYHELEMLFCGDPEISMEFIEKDYTIRLFVDNERKAAALDQLLMNEVSFGNVILHVVVIHPNREKTIGELFEEAFEKNPAMNHVKRKAMPDGQEFQYILFQNRVVQYFNDDLGDPYGNRSTLYQDIAKDVFKENAGVFFCTDTRRVYSHKEI